MVVFAPIELEVISGLMLKLYIRSYVGLCRLCTLQLSTIEIHPAFTECRFGVLSVSGCDLSVCEFARLML